MNVSEIFSPTQIVGYVAYAVTAVAFGQKRDKRLLVLNGAGASLWVIQYVMLGTYAGAVTEGLVVIRSLLSAYIENKKHKHAAALIFLAAFAVGGGIAYRQPYDLLNIAACMVGTISMIYLRQFALRYGLLVSCSLWFVFNCCAGSIGGALAGVTLVVIQIVTLFSMYADKPSELTREAP